MTAIALKLSRTFTSNAAVWAPRPQNSLRRTAAHRFDLAAVLTLMASSAAYAAWTLSHLA